MFLDYDGTLTPIVARPELAISGRFGPPPLAASLGDLSRHDRDRTETSMSCASSSPSIGLGMSGVTVSISLVPAQSGLRHQVAEAFGAELDAVESELRRRTDGIEGVLVERKRFSHLNPMSGRSTHDGIPAWRRSWTTCDRPIRTLRREGGKMLYELRPDIDWDKGTAVQWLLDGMGIEPSAALYVGDDLTDETVFAALAGDGATVLVAGAQDRRSTFARFRLNDPDGVRMLLEGLVAHRSRM